MKQVHLSAFVLLAGLAVGHRAFAAATITPISESRRISVGVEARDYSGEPGPTDSDQQFATPGAPFSASTSRTVGSPLYGANATASASQNSSMSSTSIMGSGMGYGFADYGNNAASYAAGGGVSRCDITFTIDSDTGYHLTGSLSVDNMSEGLYATVRSAVTLYSGTSDVIQHFEASQSDPVGGPFDVAGILPAGTYRIWAEGVGHAESMQGRGSLAGSGAFSFNFSVPEDPVRVEPSTWGSIKAIYGR